MPRTEQTCPTTIGRLWRKKEEAEQALREIVLEEALEDAPNLVRFLKKRFGVENIHVGDVEVDDDPHSRQKSEKVHLKFGTKRGFELGEYTRCIDELGNTISQRYSHNGYRMFDYEGGKRTDKRRSIRFP